MITGKMHLVLGLVAAASLATTVAGTPEAAAQSHPPGVDYPLRAASIQPDGLAQPLPSTRRYCLVWADQLADAVISISDDQKAWIVNHYVGSQKLFQRQIDEYRGMNPNFLMLVYHLAYGLNGADHGGGSPVGNITGPNRWGQEDTDCFQPYWDEAGGDREEAYMHVDGSGFLNRRVQFPDPFWLMDIRSEAWRGYFFSEMLAWQAFPTDNATGAFLDVAFHPWYNYEPANWWTDLGVGASHPELAAWWNPLAVDYFNAMRDAFAPGDGHPRYIVLPNADCLQDEEPGFLDATDGAFTENWQCVLASRGTWFVSARRIARYITSKGKVWFVEINTLPSGAERNLLIGSYFLLKNATSYYYIVGGGEITWYPEYEIDLGWYLEEPPEDVEELRAAGDAGGDGIYRRDYSHGMVLVNGSDRELSTDIGPDTYRAAAFSGGGAVNESGAMPSYTLAYEGSYSGSVSVPARSSLILQVEAGPPPPGEEPVDPPADEGGEPGPEPMPDIPLEDLPEGADVAPDATTDAPADTTTDAAADAAQDHESDPGEEDDSDSGCGCAMVR